MSKYSAPTTWVGLYHGYWYSYSLHCEVISRYILTHCDLVTQQRSGSTLAQVMACCLTVPSHYLNQCWLIISEVQWHLYQGNFTRDASIINHWNLFENYMSKISFKFPRGQWVNSLWLCDAIWHQGSWSTLPKEMACYLMAPIHYLQHCQLIIRVLWHSNKWQFRWNC